MLYNQGMPRFTKILAYVLSIALTLFITPATGGIAHAQNNTDYYGPETQFNTNFNPPPPPGKLCCPIGTFKDRDANARGGKCSQAMYTRAKKDSNLEPCCGWFIKQSDGEPKFTITEAVDCTLVEPKSICSSITNATQAEICKTCLKNRGVYTSLGCIPISGDDLIVSLARIGIGLLGGVLLIIILAAAFKLSTSRGDPKTFEEGKSMLTAGISGTLFILFSMVVLEAIGVNILRIPGF